MTILPVADDDNAAAPGWFTREEFERGFAIDPATGLLTAILMRNGHRWVAIPVTVTLQAQFDGVECRGPRGGVEYADTVTLSALRLLGAAKPTVRHLGIDVEYWFTGDLGGVPLSLIYVVHPTSPAIDMRVQVGGEQGTLRVLRQLVVELVIRDAAAPTWTVNAPGNQLRRDVAIGELGSGPVGVSPIGGLRGSSGLIMITDDLPRTLVIWPNNPAEIATLTMCASSADTLIVEVSTNLAADLASGVLVDCQIFSVDIVDGTAEDVRSRWPAWASRLALTSPVDKPDWMHGASLYEIQIGAALFRGGHSYCPYPTVADLIDDLDRIIALGFTIIQVMPRHPYPSYNVHDYFDISESYGDAAGLVELVERCHRRGVRVILDVLLHGVIDNEAITEAADGVRAGPIAGKLDDDPGDIHGVDISQGDRHHIAWSRHILDFEDAWRTGSPQRAALQEEHPEWFFRNSAGDVTSVYTKGFDARHNGWRDYFRGAMLFLLDELTVDGFRFDAPTYNSFANWAEWSRDRASASALACVALFEDLRRDIKRVRPDALMYTEPSGHLLRRSMDLNYNYDEQWLVSALAQPDHQPPRAVSSARQFLEWMSDRDAFLPVGSQTAHHIDSHDTFWWPAWGGKWRREQFGIDATRALAASFMALDGPYMMFTGGEVGIENLLTAMNELRHDPERFWFGRGSYLTHRSEDVDDSVLIVRRPGLTRDLDVIVNLSPTAEAEVPLPPGRGRVVHFWHGRGDAPAASAAIQSLPPHSVLLISAETPNGLT